MGGALSGCPAWYRGIVIRSLREADEPTIRTLDGLVALWTVLWLVLAGWTAYSVWVLADLGQTITSAGNALDSAGKGLQSIGQVPVVGEGPKGLGDQVRATAGQVVANGMAFSGQVHRLAVLLGLTTFFVPVTPILGLWAPMRLARRHEAAEMQRAVQAHGDDPALVRYLAGRAVERLPYRELRSVTDDPCGDLVGGRWDRLAALELHRMGVDVALGDVGGRPGGDGGSPA